jgi:hypothetical protein
MGRYLSAALLALLVSGCSNNDTPKADALPDKKPHVWLDGNVVVAETGSDRPAPDSGLPCDPASIGKFCKTSTDCNGKAGMTCLWTKSNPNTGICTCKCKPDDSKTTAVNEDTCSEAASGKNKCLTVTLSTGSQVGYCFKTCKPKIGSNDCPTGVACDPWSTVSFDPDIATCALAGCAADADCPVTTATVCSVQSKNCPTGETCIAVATGQDEGHCNRPGKCDTVSGLCDAHSLGKSTAAVGDRCDSDLDCAGNMHCVPEWDENKFMKKGGVSCTNDSECCSRNCDATTKSCTKAICTLLRRHGYCSVAGCQFGDTLTVRACPQGSACNLHLLTGYCQKICDMTKASDCRGAADELYGDYECRRWGNLPRYMKDSVAVCDFGTVTRCSWFGTSGYDCSIFTNDPTKATNPTNMKCRGLDGKDAPDGLLDVNGFCLDDTSSGSAFRSPLPTP